MWKCPVCETEYDDSVQFCEIDGTKKVVPVARPVEPATWVCPACRTTNDGFYCKNCGHKKGMDSEPKQPTQTGGEAPPVKPRTWVCAKCNTLNSEGATVCMRCRTPRNFNENTALREKMHAMEAQKSGARVAAILCIFAILLLFAFPYIIGDYNYTVYNNMTGANGDVEKACSIVALLFVLLPVPFLLAKLDIRKRNLPFTIVLICAGAVGVYCCVIFFGSDDVNATMPLIMAAQALAAIFIRGYVKLMEEIENLLFHGGL